MCLFKMRFYFILFSTWVFSAYTNVSRISFHNVIVCSDILSPYLPCSNVLSLSFYGWPSFVDHMTCFFLGDVQLFKVPMIRGGQPFVFSFCHPSRCCPGVSVPFLLTQPYVSGSSLFHPHCFLDSNWLLGYHWVRMKFGFYSPKYVCGHLSTLILFSAIL